MPNLWCTLNVSCFRCGYVIISLCRCYTKMMKWRIACTWWNFKWHVSEVNLGFAMPLTQNLYTIFCWMFLSHERADWSILASIWRAYISIYYFILLPKLTSLITTSLKKYGRLASLAFWRKFWLQYIKCLRMFVLFSSIIKFLSFECTILAAKRNPPASLQLFFLIIDVNQIFISLQ